MNGPPPKTEFTNDNLSVGKAYEPLKDKTSIEHLFVTEQASAMLTQQSEI
jgi:hypothetical protein